jgi:hypothetical protein
MKWKKQRWNVSATHRILLREILNKNKEEFMDGDITQEQYDKERNELKEELKQIKRDVKFLQKRGVIIDG